MKGLVLSLFVSLLFAGCTPKSNDTGKKKRPDIKPVAVEVNDSFWTPKFDRWQTVTVHDVFDKFEGKYTPEGSTLEKDFEVMGETRNAFMNFDLVAEGKRGIGVHHGPPWYDGLIYETIRGTADLLAQKSDSALEARIDGYIDRIAAAQASEKDGYINTYTQLMHPEQRWGFNGGMLRWQHDVYNGGMLVEAGVHYYKATGKTKLLEVATRFANLMVTEMGPAPKKNVVPAHSGPEESLTKLYQLYRDDPELKTSMGLPINERDYFDLVTFWIEHRGKNAGLPLWKKWGDEASEKWIHEGKYTDSTFGNHSRPSWGDYAQDSIPVFQQKTIEGHAVRATLLAAGITAAAMENKDLRYINAATELWDNMVGKRMFITGGVGAIARDEKFGADYYLPNAAYLETCAAVGAGFFSQKMNQLTRHGKYMDEFERSLYNNVLTGISLDGTNYTYQNPLAADSHHRWGWHDCPCCPPMFLKMVSAIPDFIYSVDTAGITVNLFVGSTATFELNDDRKVTLEQTTNYPWEGKTTIALDLDSIESFVVRVRIPGWATGVENPYGLYRTDSKGGASLSVNGQVIPVAPVNGYAIIDRAWSPGDKIELRLPMEPRIVRADERVADLKGMVSISSGPLVYCLEKNMNKGLDQVTLDPGQPMSIAFNEMLLEGVNVISGSAMMSNGSRAPFRAIPYFAAGNSRPGDGYKVWVRARR